MLTKQRLRHVTAMMKEYLRQPVRSFKSQLRQPAMLQAAQFAREWPAVGPDTSADALEASTPSNPLQEYFDAHHEGPGIHKWRHYFEIYHRHLAKFIGKDVHVLEIGVFGGGSLEMWRSYFGPNVRITGVDVVPECKKHENEYTKIVIGDQEDRSFWKKLRAEIPPIDIIIDDGGHQPEQQIVTLEESLPFLRPGGVFICEDVHVLGNHFISYLGGLNDAMNALELEPHPLGEKDVLVRTTPFQSWIHSIHQYPYVVVIEKRDQPMPSFEAIHHGTEWPA